MKWLRRLLPVFLAIVLLLSIGSVVYADDKEDGLNVDIAILGDSPDVEVDIYGDDAEVWINGRNLNEPTVIIQNSGSRGTSKGWILKRIDQAVGSLYTWAGETKYMLGLTMDGLAKVIITVEAQDSQLDVASSDVDELRADLDTQTTQLGNHETRLFYLDAQVEALVSEDAILQAYVTDYANYLQADYDRKLMTIVTIFSVMVVGLAVGFGVGFGISIHRLQKRL